MLYFNLKAQNHLLPHRYSIVCKLCHMSYKLGTMFIISKTIDISHPFTGNKAQKISTTLAVLILSAITNLYNPYIKLYLL